MKKLTDIIEAAGLHPDALHVSHVKVDGQTKYKVKAVGKNLSDGIKVGEHLTDTHLDDAAEMGAKIKHIKEEVELVGEKYSDKQKAMKVGAQVGYDSPSGDREPKADYIKGQAADGAKMSGRVQAAADLLKKSGLKSAFNKGVKAGGDTKKAEVKATVDNYMKRNEEVEQVTELKKTTLGSYINKASKDAVGHGFNLAKSVSDKNWKEGGDAGDQVNKRLKGVAQATKKLTKEEVELQEGAEAHAQFQQYHNDSSKLLKGIGGALSKHYDNVTNKKGWNGGEANWNHVAEIKGAHRQLQDLHDAILQVGEYHKPMTSTKLGVKEEVEPEADMNILVQLRKPIDILEHGTQGGADITFGDGQKVFVEGTTAKKLVESMEKIKPEDRVKVAEFLYQSHDNLMAVYARLK